MKKYNIKVNGKSYDVEVELIGAEQPAAPAPAVKTAEAPKPQKAPEPSGVTGAVKIQAPMPGTIIKVNVKTGDKVTKGQVLCVLEAMKMENEISAPQDGTVSSINVSAGAAVESGALLVSLN